MNSTVLNIGSTNPHHSINTISLFFFWEKGIIRPLELFRLITSHPLSSIHCTFFPFYSVFLNISSLLLLLVIQLLSLFYRVMVKYHPQDCVLIFTSMFIGHKHHFLPFPIISYIFSFLYNSYCTAFSLHLHSLVDIIILYRS